MLSFMLRHLNVFTKLDVVITQSRTRDTGDVRSDGYGDDLATFPRTDCHVTKCHKRPHK